MSGAGDTMIDDILSEGAKATKDRSTEPGVCGAHDGIRLAVYALVLAEQDRRKSQGINLGPVHVTGWSSALVGLAYVIAKLHGVDVP